MTKKTRVLKFPHLLAEQSYRYAELTYLGLLLTEKNHDADGPALPYRPSVL